MQNPLIVALDVDRPEKALRLVDLVASRVGAFKIGSELFTLAGPEVVRRVRSAGADVFLDLKFHDIPHTVGRAVQAAVQLDVQMLTVHTSGGRAMLEEAEHAARHASQRLGRPVPLVLGVTVLTSLDDQELDEIGFRLGAGPQVERLARLALTAGLRGLVCSPLEVAALRAIVPPTFQLVTPGIRTADDAQGDQKRTLSPASALAAGANRLVVGRPIYAAADPGAAVDKILAAIGGAAAGIGG
jgi:orotidine-5'-phosphate decarboxylase